MTYENWLNLILTLIAIGLIACTYFKYYVNAENESERLFVKIISGIGALICVVDAIVSKVVNRWM